MGGEGLLIGCDYVCAWAAPERLPVHKAIPLSRTVTLLNLKCVPPQVMYDEDLADEEIILAWASKDDAAKALGVSPEAAAAARAAAAPVVEWLEEADDDEDEDDQDDEDDQ
eukprot:365882-Chlamydomonas_euryale.AAC.4